MDKLALGTDRMSRRMGSPSQTAHLENGHVPNPSPVRILFVSFGSPWHYALWNNLSVDTLAGDLSGEFGPAVALQSVRVESFADVDAVAERLRDDQPDIVGLSVELGTLKLVDKFADSVASWRRNARPILAAGNQVPTYFPDRFLADERLQGILVCLHEGELFMRGLVEHVRSGRSLEEIPNLVYRDQSGNIRQSPLQTIDLDLLTHPPSADSARPGITNMIQASRGCIFSCSYCTRHQNWDAGHKIIPGHVAQFDRSSWRPFPLSRVLATVERFILKGIHEIEFCDDEFFGGRSARCLDRVHAFAEGMQFLAEKHQTKMAFRLFTTPLIVARSAPDEETRQQNARVKDAILHLQKAGLVRVYIGLESGTAAQKDRYRRRETLADTALALEVLRGLGLDVDIGFIMFDPYLTVAELLENIDYFKRHHLIHHNTWPFRPLVVNEGTPIKYTLAADGLLTGKQDPDFLAYEYKYAHAAVGSIAQAIQALAKETAPIFSALKSISKAHWRDEETIVESFARWATEANARVYLDYMESLGRGTVEKTPAEAIARSRIMHLVKLVQQGLAAGLFSARVKDRDVLSRHIDEFTTSFSQAYCQPCPQTPPSKIPAESHFDFFLAEI